MSVPPATSPNFAFLASHDPFLESLGAAAERYFTDDPGAALFKLRLLGGRLAQRAAALTGVYVGPDDGQAELLRRLQDRRAITREVADLFHSLRRAGNAAAHEGRGSRMEALQQLKIARQVAVWFHRWFGNAPSFNPGTFVPPVDPHEADAALAAELAQLREAVIEHFDAIKVGLTATPALHTKEILGAPVFEYSYRKAVVDGVLVDHEPPVRIVTQLASDGISFKAGEEVAVYDPSTQAIDKVNQPPNPTRFPQRTSSRNLLTF